VGTLERARLTKYVRGLGSDLEGIAASKFRLSCNGAWGCFLVDLLDSVGIWIEEDKMGQHWIRDSSCLLQSETAAPGD
jgi:hypothetical protein